MASEKKESEEKGPKGLEPYRATAQQNAIEAIRSAELRYAKAKGEGGEAKEAGHALGGSGSVTGEKMHEAKERAGDAVSVVAEKGRQAGEYVVEKAGAVKDSVKETTSCATEYVGQKTTQVKEKIGEQTQAAQEKLKGMTIGEKKEGGEAAGAAEERAEKGEEARGPRSRHTHWHSWEHEQACKATKLSEEDMEVMPCSGSHHENKGEKEEGGGKEEMAGEGEQTRGGGGGGILQAMGETVVGIMQTARDMIVGRNSH